jgi:hypothetical protein
MKYLLLVIAILSLPCSAHAACTVAQNSFDAAPVAGAPDLGQSWTAVCDGVLSSITVNAGGAHAGPYTLSVFSGESVDPGDLLAQAPNIALADGENTIAIPTEVTVSNGQLYTFQFDAWVLLRGKWFIDAYPDGRVYGLGVFLPAGEGDLWFEAEISDRSATGGSDSGCFISTLVDH